MEDLPAVAELAKGEDFGCLHVGVPSLLRTGTQAQSQACHAMPVNVPVSHEAVAMAGS